MHRVAILTVFSLVHTDDHALAVDVRNLQVDDFEDAQAGCVGSAGCRAKSSNRPGPSRTRIARTHRDVEICLPHPALSAICHVRAGCHVPLAGQPDMAARSFGRRSAPICARELGGTNVHAGDTLLPVLAPGSRGGSGYMCAMIGPVVRLRRQQSGSPLHRIVAANIRSDTPSASRAYAGPYTSKTARSSRYNRRRVPTKHSCALARSIA